MKLQTPNRRYGCRQQCRTTIGYYLNVFYQKIDLRKLLQQDITLAQIHRRYFLRGEHFTWQSSQLLKIKFTSKKPEQNTLPFFDTNILLVNQSFEFHLYIKLTLSDSCLLSPSFFPSSRKHNLVLSKNRGKNFRS